MLIKFAQSFCNSRNLATISCLSTELPASCFALSIVVCVVIPCEASARRCLLASARSTYRYLPYDKCVAAMHCSSRADLSTRFDLYSAQSQPEEQVPQSRVWTPEQMPTRADDGDGGTLQNTNCRSLNKASLQNPSPKFVSQLATFITKMTGKYDGFDWEELPTRKS